MDEQLSDQPQVPPTIKTLESEVIEFGETLPYFAKYIADKILINSAITDDELDAAYSYFLEEVGLRPSTAKPNITIDFNSTRDPLYKDDLLLKQIQKVEGVNALVEGQTITLCENLTIIFGENGAGKSGYSRLLKKVFYSKAPEDILPNIYKDAVDHKALKAEFIFEAGSTQETLCYPTDAVNAEFRQFAVFDGKSVLRHLEGRNEFEFRPAGLSFFAEFTKALVTVENYLIRDSEKRRSPNNYALLFDGDSIINKFLVELSEHSDIRELKKLCPYTQADIDAKSKLQTAHDSLFIELGSKDKRDKDLRLIIQALDDVKKSFLLLNKYFEASTLNKVKNAVADYIIKDKLAKQEGIDSIKSDKIVGIGTPEWKLFIEAAERFSKIQNTEDIVYPQDGDECLFCHQSISSTAKDLILRYWSFIKSQVEQEAKTAKSLLDTMKDSYEKLSFDLFNKDSVLTAYMVSSQSTRLALLRNNLAEQKKLSETVIFNIEFEIEADVTPVMLDTTEILELITELESSLGSDTTKQMEELGSLADQLRYYSHKEKLQAHIDAIDAFIKDLQWVSKANVFSWVGIKQKTTRAEKQLSSSYFNDRYIDQFNKECEKLNGKFLIDVDPKSSGAKSNRQLFIKGKAPSAILSEGEQKIIAIADFLAEMHLNDINRGIIFDDPVNSLDNTRKEEIANRLVEECKSKQVIIFTHDLVFLSKLLIHCDSNSIASACHWVETLDGTPGYVWINNGPSHERAYRNSEIPKKHYSAAALPTCPPSEREQTTKLGITALRTCYEVLVINGLFGNVVRRWEEKVSIDSLTSVSFDQAIVNELMDSYAQCCRYMEGHSHSDKYSYKKPTPADLNEEISRFDVIKGKIKAAKPKRT
jgi:AAA domain-containing protein